MRIFEVLKVKAEAKTNKLNMLLKTPFPSK
jgi:hypothetical protein